MEKNKDNIDLIRSAFGTDITWEEVKNWYDKLDENKKDDIKKEYFFDVFGIGWDELNLFSENEKIYMFYVKLASHLH